MEEALEQMPCGLKEAFAETLQRIQKQSDGQDKLGMETLLWIVHARRPLLVKELSEALAVRPGSTVLRPRFRPSQKRMVDCCMGLVTVDEKSSVIRLVHFSVQEYLHECQDGILGSGERTVAEGCITYLLFEPFALGPRHDENEIEDLVSKNVFAKYAAHYWGAHVKATDHDEMDHLVLDFLRADPQRGCSLQILHYTTGLREEYWSDEEARSCNGLHLAAMFGLETLGKRFIGIPGIGVDDPTRMGTTALIKAAAGGHQNFTKMLLSMQADPTKENWYGTALHCAAESGEVATILILLEAGVSVDIKDRRGRTSLHCATVSGHTHVMQALLNNGANVNAVCNKNYTPLRYAVVWEQPAGVVRVLLNHGADTEIRSSHNVTPLHDAAVMDSNDIALLLLKYKADVYAKDVHGGTPLHFAAERNHASVARYLLDHGANIDATADNGATALYLAAGNGSTKAVRLLLHRGADMEVGDEEGLTPLDVAIREYHEASIQSLVVAGAKLHQEPNMASQFEVKTDGWMSDPTPHCQADKHPFYDLGISKRDEEVTGSKINEKSSNRSEQTCDMCRVSPCSLFEHWLRLDNQVRNIECDKLKPSCGSCVARQLECTIISRTREEIVGLSDDCEAVFSRPYDLK